MAEEKFIQKAIKRPGQLHRDLGVPLDKKIPLGVLRAAAKRSGKIGQRARLAITLRKMNPWEVMKDDSGWWVVKKDTREKVHKSAHGSEQEARQHMEALYAAEGFSRGEAEKKAKRNGSSHNPGGKSKYRVA